MMKKLIAKISEAVYDRVILRIDPKIIRFLLIRAAFFCAAVTILRQYRRSDLIFMEFWFCEAIMLIELLFITVLSISRQPRKIRWNTPLLCSLLLSAGLIIVSSFVHPIGGSYRLFAVFCLMFVSLYGVWGQNGKYGELLETVAWGFLIVLAVFVILNLRMPYVKNPNKDYRYAGDFFGITGNPNHIPTDTLPAIAVALFLIKRSKETWKQIVSALVLGSSALMTVISHSRCGYLGMIAVFTVFALDCFLTKRNAPAMKKLLKKALLVAGVAAVSAAASYTAVTVLKADVIAAIPMKEHTSEEKTSEEKTSETLWERYAKKRYEIEELSDEELLKLDETDRISYSVKRDINNSLVLTIFDNIGTERLYIAMCYGRSLNLFGHEEYPMYGILGTHNQPLHIAYIAGIPAGICWLLFIVLCGISAVRCFIKNREWSVFVLMVYMVFFIEAMLETGFLPTTNIMIMLGYFAFAPLFVTKSENDGIE